MIKTNESHAMSLEWLNGWVLYDYRRPIRAFYQAAVENKLPVALWRYPRSQAQHALVDFNGVVQTTKIDFTKGGPGFAFSPFVNEGGTSTLFIKASLYLNSTGHYLYENRSPFDNLLETDNKTRFLTTYQCLAYGDEPLDHGWVTTQTQPHICTKAEYCALVEAAIEYMKSTGIKKIVTSRATETPLPPNFNPLVTFDQLCNRYPHAFVSLVSIPGVGTWIGVSPEVLLRLRNNEIHTVALAGTQPRPTYMPLSKVTWGTKEIEEQALVSDYIRNFFQELHLGHFSEDGPYTVSAGQIVHLQTEFKVKLDEPQLSHLANHILYTLHPTSAVCGMPKQEALSFILEKEQYDRAFYSGFLGPVHLDHQSHLYVNLRCMQLKRDRAILYVGGGITRDSVPQEEWMETVLKSKTLLNVLQPEPSIANHIHQQ